MVYHICGKCDYKTNRKFNLKIHFQRKHANENFELKEDDSSRKSTICEQIKSQPNPVTSVGRNQCNRCGYLFSLKSSLTKHYKKCKGFIINPLQCEICLKTFSTRQGKCSHKKMLNVYLLNELSILTILGLSMKSCADPWSRTVSQLNKFSSKS